MSAERPKSDPRTAPAPTAMPGPPRPAGADTEFTSRRETVRIGFLRANRAVAVILVLVLVLGLAMALVSQRAAQNQSRAEQAEEAATERLWHSSVAQARAERLSTEAGHRIAALNAISNAAAIRPHPELRTEAIAALGMRDLVREWSWPLRPRAYGFHFDPGLEHYVVSYQNDALTLFRLADNSELRTFRAGDAGLPTNAPVREFRFSATGRYAVVLYGNGATVLWERDTGRPALVLGGPDVPARERPAWPPNFSSDDRVLAARSAGARQLLLRFSLPDGALTPVECSVPLNDSFRINARTDVATVLRGREILLLNARDGTQLGSFQAVSEVLTLWWDQRGDQFSASCRDASVHVWDARTGISRQLEGRAAHAWMQQFSPDGRLLATAGVDGTSRLWDLPSGRLISRSAEGRALVFGRDGERIAYGVPGREVGVWRISPPVGYRIVEALNGEEGSPVHQDLSPDGRWLAATTPARGNRPGFALIDLTGRRAPAFLADTSAVFVAFHPTRGELFLGSGGGLTRRSLPTTDANPATTAWDASGPFAEPARPVTIPDGFLPRALSFNRDGSRAVLADARGRLVVMQPDRPGEFVPLEGQLVLRSELSGPASLTGSGAVALSPDGRWVVAGRETRDGRPVVWDAGTGRIVHRLPTEPSQVAFSPDGRWLATIGAAQCQVWTAGTWESRWQRLRPPLLGGLGSATFSGDGTLLAFTRSYTEIELADVATGERLAGLGDGETLGVAGLRLSADGQTLAAPGPLGRLHLWDLPVLRRELAKWNLDWPAAAAGARPQSTASSTLASGAAAALAVVAIAVPLGLLVLRRQRRLTDEFLRTSDLAAQRTRELAAERELGELKSRFVSLVSHEFRTPLGITMSAVELLRNYMSRLSPEKLRELLDDIYSATLRMSSLMEQVLLLGRVEAGKISFQARPMELPILCGKLIDETYSATSRRCPIELETEGELDGALGDEGLFRHALSNLLSNAVKYSPDGGTVVFSVRREGGDAVIRVQDRGIGIPEADQPRLFEAFHRAMNVGEIPGTGLGLLIVRRCVELHRGHLSFVSSVGQGTTFTVRLPLFQKPSSNSEPGHNS